MLLKGGIATNFSGRSGDVVFAHNRSGIYARDFTSPTDPGTARQLLLRGALTSANVAWRAETISVRTIWENYAAHVTSTNRFGEKRHVTGRSQYVAWYLAFTGALGGTPGHMHTPRILSLSATPVFISHTLKIRAPTLGILSVTYRFMDPGPAPYDDGTMVCYSSGILAGTRNFWKQEYPFHAIQSLIMSARHSVNISFNLGSGWDILGGEKCFYKVRFLRDDGRLSPFVYGNILSVPE